MAVRIKKTTETIVSRLESDWSAEMCSRTGRGWPPSCRREESLFRNSYYCFIPSLDISHAHVTHEVVTSGYNFRLGDKRKICLRLSIL
jgi:hypothetical protein